MPTIDLAALSSTGLLPCPFCGSVDLEQITVGGNVEQPSVWIQCAACNATGPGVEESLGDQHRLLWDNRWRPEQ